MDLGCKRTEPLRHLNQLEQLIKHLLHIQIIVISSSFVFAALASLLNLRFHANTRKPPVQTYIMYEHDTSQPQAGNDD